MSPLALLSLLSAGFCLSISTSASAFDCAKAKSPAEKAICGAPDVKAADDAMNGAFAAARGRLDAQMAKALLVNQRAWLKERNTTCLDGAPNGACFRREDEKRTNALSGRPEAGPGTKTPLVPVFIERPGTKSTYEISLMLYRFLDPNGPGEKLFNARMDALIAKAPNRTDDSSGTFSYSYDRKARIAYASDRLLSVDVVGYDFTGGAHGQSSASAVTIDLAKGKELTMADLASKDALKPIVKACQAQIEAAFKAKLVAASENPDTDADAKAQLKSLSADSAAGVSTTTSDLSSWRFGAASATVTFVADDIAPHALGEFSCDVPYAQLRQVAKPDFPLP